MTGVYTRRRLHKRRTAHLERKALNPYLCVSLAREQYAMQSPTYMHILRASPSSSAGRRLLLLLPVSLSLSFCPSARGASFSLSYKYTALGLSAEISRFYTTLYFLSWISPLRWRGMRFIVAAIIRATGSCAYTTLASGFLPCLFIIWQW